MYKFIVSIESDVKYDNEKDKNIRYFGHVMASIGVEYMQMFNIPLKRIPTVVRNKINQNTLILIYTDEDYEPEYVIEHPEVLPYENGVYFEMIWKNI